MKAGIPILLYHDLESDVCPNEKTNPATRDTVVSAFQFEKQMQFFARSGFRTLSLRELLDPQKAKTPNSSRDLVITFDDGHYSHYHLAFPILQKYGFRGTFFVIADRLGQPYHVTREHLREMIQKGMEIGSHGLTHEYLPLLGERAVRRECLDSKKILESATGNSVDYFAFPGGHYDRTALKWVKETGYQGACSCLQGLNSTKTDPFLLRRIEIRGKVSAEGIGGLLDPGAITFYRLLDGLKGLLRKSIGLRAYTRLRSKLYHLYLFKR